MGVGVVILSIANNVCVCGGGGDHVVSLERRVIFVSSSKRSHCNRFCSPASVLD